MKLGTILLAILVLLATPAPAHAELISTAIGLTAFIASTAGVTSATAAAIGAAIIYTTVAVGASLISQALLTKPDEGAADSSSSGADLSVRYGSAIARSAIMGPGATGGHHVFTNVYGPTNEAMECVFVIGDGKHGKITRLQYNGKECTLPVGGLGPGVTYAVPEFVVLGTPCVGLRYYDGRFDQTADPSLIAHSNPAGRWTTDHKGRGVAYLYVHQVYAEGDVGLTGVPSLLIETEGLMLYDPRKDSTNGGSGPHRWGQVDTYEPSANPAIQEYNYRRGVLVDGKRILGMSMTPPNLILQMYFAAANINDEPIPLAAGGTEPRYRCSISVSDDRAASNVLSSLRAATAGYSLERGGQFGPIPGVPQVPIASLAFTDDDLIVGAPATFTKYRSRSELVTATFGQFADPAQFWVPTAFPPRELAADDAALGERIAKSLDLTQVYSSSQAQRIAESERRRVLQQGQGTATLPAKWIGVQPGDWLPYNSARHGSMTVLITGVNLDTAAQRVAITYERIANSVYSWTTAGELFPPDVGAPGQPGTIIMIASGMTATGVNLPGDGGLMTPGIQFAWTPILDPTVEQIDFEIRRVGDANVMPFAADFPEAGSAVCSGRGIAAATAYEYRHKLFTFPLRDTPWSAWLTVTSGDQHVVPSALAATTVGDVYFDDILGTIIDRQIDNATITARMLHDEAVTATKFASGLQPVKIGATFPPAPAAGSSDPVTFFNTTTKKLYRWDPTGGTGGTGAWIATVPTTDLTGKIIEGQIDDAAVTADKLHAEAVTATKFASGIQPVGTGTALPGAPTSSTDPLTFYNTTTRKLYRWDPAAPGGAAWVTTVPTSDLSGTIGEAQIGPGAVTQLKLGLAAVVADAIAGGAVTTNKLAVAVSSNMLFNPDLLAGPTRPGHVLGFTTAGNTFAANGLWNGVGDWGPVGMRSGFLSRAAGGPAGSISEIELRLPKAAGGFAYYPVVEGQRYEFSAHLLMGATAVVVLQFYDTALTTYVEVSGGAAPGSAIKSENGIVAYARYGVLGQCPAGKTWVKPIIRFNYPNTAAQNDFWTACYFGPASPNQVDFSPWSPSGATVIDGGQIYADSVTAAQIAAGTITSDEIATHTILADNIFGNTIRAGEIAAGAIQTDELDTGAVTADKLFAGSVTTQKLAVGISGNIFPNSDLTSTNSAGACVSGNSNTGLTPNIGIFTGSPWRPYGMNSFQISYFGIGTPANGTFHQAAFLVPAMAGGFQRLPVYAGQKYEVSIHCLGFGCSINVYMGFYDVNGTSIGNGTVTGSIAATGGGSSMTLADWPRACAFIVPPAGAVSAYVIANAVFNGSANPSFFTTGIFVAPASPNQVDFSPWSPAGATIIDGGQIVTDTITAREIKGRTITTDEIAVGTILAGNISGNTITGGQIFGGAINTSELHTGAVTADILGAGAVTTSKLAVGTAANMLANPDLNGGLVGYVLGYSSIPGSGLYLDGVNDWGALGMTGGIVNSASATVGQRAEVVMVLPKAGGGTTYHPCAEGQKYEFSFNALNSSINLSAVIQFHSADFSTYVEYAGLTSPFEGSTFRTRNGATTHARWGVISGPAPANKPWMKAIIRGDVSTTGFVQFWFEACFLAPAAAAQVAPNFSPWAPSGATVITGGQIVTNSITADKILANSITTNQLAATNVITAAGQINNLVVKNIHIQNAQISVANFTTHGGGALGTITQDLPITVFGVGGTDIILETFGTFLSSGAGGVAGTSVYSIVCLETGATMVSGQCTQGSGAWATCPLTGGGKFTASSSGNVITMRLTLSYGGGTVTTADVRWGFVAFLR